MKQAGRMKPTVRIDTERADAQIAYVKAKLAGLERTQARPGRDRWGSVRVWFVDLTNRDLTWRERLAPDFVAHRLVHNGPLWWTCRGCRELRRAEKEQA